MKFIHLFLFLFMVQYSTAQSNQAVYYNAFDDIVGTYSSDLNTGQRFEDLYPTNSDMEFRYFQTSQFSVGRVKYNSQVYYQSHLKYDLLNDNVIYENIKAFEKYPIILNESFVEAFAINNRNFVKLSEKAAKFSFYKNGFFEVLMESDQFNLYLKHEKFVRKKIGNNTIYYTYNYKESIVLMYNFEFYQIDSRNDVITILPEKKEEIKKFYRTYKKLESQNKSDFMKKLFTSMRDAN